jgi:adenylyltransferase/sulfurtransferase
VLSDKSVLVIGLGGLGCPALLALARSSIGSVVLCDDDRVSLSNLHRQLLFEESDIGKDKLTVARRRLLQLNRSWSVELVASRFLPNNALELARSVDLIIEGADNFATKFLAADAAFLAQKPVVHGAGVRWTATVFGVSGKGGPCYRCLFEELPSVGAGLNCDEAGVMGPVVGIAGALMADVALGMLGAETSRQGSIFTYDGKSDRLRQVEVPTRHACPLCGESKSISEINEARYLAPSCAAQPEGEEHGRNHSYSDAT